MSGGTPYEALHNFRSSLQREISCVTDSVIVIRDGGYRPGSEHFLTLGTGEPVRLPRSDIALWLRRFTRVVEQEIPQAPWRVDTIGYLYALLDREGREIFAYQWHPAQRSPVTFPHLHLGTGARVGRKELEKAHLPTGHVELEDVLSLAIQGFGVPPRRNDWEDILGGRRT